MINENMLNEYSTEEKVVGKWINNKPIYRRILIKELELPSKGSDVTSVLVNHEIPDIDLALDCKTIVSNGIVFPYIAFNKGISSVVRFNNEYIDIRYYSDYFGKATWYFILEYTKTTD